MGFIEKLNKYGKKISFSQTGIYQKIQESKTSLEAKGIKVKIKNVFDLFDYEILYYGLLNQNLIENAYELFLSQQYDMLEYLNYDEKRKMFNSDLEPLLKDKPFFYHDESQTDIYIPYLEPFVNQRYINDYQMFLLKQHSDYLKKYKIDRSTPSKLYGVDIYRTVFSSLIDVYEDERHLCYYFDEMKTVYIFQKETNKLLNHVILLDHISHDEIDIEDVKKVTSYIENYLYKDCLDFMLEKQWIGQKTYKKVIKKYH